MAKKSAAKKKPTARAKAAPARTSRKSARQKASARAAKARKAAPAARKSVKKAPRKVARKAAPRRAGAGKATARKAPPARKAAAGKKPTAKKAPARKVSVSAVTRKAAAARTKIQPQKAGATRRPTTKRPAVKASAVRPAPAPRHVPALDRERRTVGETAPPSPPSSFVSNRHASSASSGADEMRVKLAAYTGTGPAITAGDVDANWESAESVGDEAPGGDNPTPDQDVVEEIGRALGVEYDDDEELQGGDEIAARDHDRWELDPASSDDFDER